MNLNIDIENEHLGPLDNLPSLRISLKKFSLTKKNIKKKITRKKEKKISPHI